MDASGAERPHEPSDDGALSFSGLTAFAAAQGAVADDGHLAVGTRLDDVTIVRFVAEGGMGRVYEALQGMPRRTVAVKVLRPGVLSPAAAKRFRQEALILGRLTHAGIARIYSVGIQPSSGSALPYFVMEYIDEAQPITAYAVARGLPVRERVRLAREACQAVAHGHLKGVVHRDLKPGNILVNAAGQPKIIDFGVARSIDGDAALTTMHTDVGQLLGTLRYMCPEQFDGTSDDVDVRADVYALGVVLYELLAGRPPYDTEGKAVHQVARIVREVEPKTLASVDRAFRGALDTIVSKCLEKDRTRRYSSAVELEADLGRYLRGEPIAAEAPGLADALVRLGRRHRLAAAAVMAVAVAVAVGMAGVGIFAVRAERARFREVAARERADAARREAIRHAEEAAAGRELARREQERADVEADTSRRLLYVANMRALQTAVANGNRQGARQIHAENLALVEGGLPLEMRCMAADLDDALVVLPAGHAVSKVGYAPDGSVLAVNTVPPRSSGYRSETRNHPQFQRMPVRADVSFHAVGPGLRYAAIPACGTGWALAWRFVAESPSPGAATVGQPVALAVSPDGSRAATYHKNGEIAVLDRLTGRLIATLAEHAGRLKHVTFSPSGDRLAGCDLQGALGLWDASDGRLIGRDGGRDERFISTLFSADGARLAAAASIAVGRDKVVVYDTRAGQARATILLDDRLTDSAVTSSLAISPDGARLVISYRQTDVTVWNTSDGTAAGTLQGHTTPVEATAFSNDGRRIATGVASGEIRVWNAGTCACEHTLTGHDGAVRSLAFHPDGDTLASGSLDGTVRIWSVEAAPPCAFLPGVTGLTAAAFSPDGRVVAVAAQGAREIGLWDAGTAERVGVLDGGEGGVAQLAWSPDGGLLAAAYETPGRVGEARVWRPAAKAPVAVLGDHASGAVSVAFSPDGTCLVTKSGDGLLTAWDPRTGARRWASRLTARHPNTRVAAVFGRGGRVVAYGPAHLLDVTSGAVVGEFLDRGSVTCLAASPGGRVLASGMAMGTVYVEDLEKETVCSRLAGHADSVRAITFSHDGTMLATGALDGTARLWNVGRAHERHCLVGHSGSIEAVFFSPDGRRLITSSNDGTTRIWGVDLGRELCILPIRADAPRAIAISPDGTKLLAPTATGGARLWGLTNAAVIAARQRSPLDGDGRSIELGEVWRPTGRPRHRLGEDGKERGEVGEVLAVEAERSQER